MISSVQVRTTTAHTSSLTSSAFTATPTVGHLMFFDVAIATTSATLTTPSGLTPLDGPVIASGGSSRKYTFYRYVQAGDTGAFTFSMSALSYITVTAYEISGAAATSPFNAHGITNNPASTSAAAPPQTPSVLGCLPIAVFSNANTNTYSGLNAGWVTDATVPSTNIASVAVHGPVTSDTTTSIDAVLTWNLSTSTLASQVLIAESFQASSSSASLTCGGAAVTITLLGGSPTYSVTTAPNGSICTASLTGNVLTLTPIGTAGGTTSVVLTDGAGATVTIPITETSSAGPLTLARPLITNYAGQGVIFITQSNSARTLTATIADGTLASVSPLSQPANGSVPVAFTVTASQGVYGETQLTISDGFTALTLSVALGSSGVTHATAFGSFILDSSLLDFGVL